MGKIGIIIGREFNQRVRKRSFILTTILMPLLMVGLMAAPVIMARMKSDTLKQILVVDRSGQIAGKLQNTATLHFTPDDRSPEALREQKPEGVFGILVIGAHIMEHPDSVTLYAYESSTLETENAIRSQIQGIIEQHKLLQYNIENLPQIMAEVKTDVRMQTVQVYDSGEEKASSSALAMGSAYVFGLLIYMFVFMYGAMVMQGVIEEKSSKVLEIMVSSVRPYELMMGKIVGIASVAITQFAIWMVLIFSLGSIALQFLSGGAAPSMPAGMGMPEGIDAQAASILRSAVDPAFLLKIFGGFMLYFIGGYLLYAAMFAAIGSAVDEVSDAQQLQLPVTIPLVLALVVLMNAMNDPDGQLAFWFSIIPFTSPVIMMARIPYGVPAWQIALSLGLLYASFVAMVWLAGKIYRVGIFMYGKKPTWKELVKWARYKY